MPASTSSPIHPVLDHLVAAVDDHQVAGGLWNVLASVPDPRRRRGVRHPIATIVAVATCAVLAGARSFAAIGEWAQNASEQVLNVLGVTRAPSESCIRRVLQRIDGDRLDAVLTRWAQAATSTPPRTGRRRVVAVDGKSPRGARTGVDGERRVHLLAAIDAGHGVVLGQRQVSTKTNEIPMFAKLLDTIDDLEGAVVTADALHAQRAHADYLVLERGAHYLLTVKRNQPDLHDQLASLPWNDVPVAHTGTSKGHGRVEKRSIKIVTVAAGIVFPHARQAIQIVRKRRKKKEKKYSAEIVYAVTSLEATDVTPAEIATYLRWHWHIENRLHWVRDMAYDEDRCQIRVSNGPQVMASLRNVAISLHRLAGATNIARALRHHAYDPLRPVNLLLNS